MTFKIIARIGDILKCNLIYSILFSIFFTAVISGIIALGLAKEIIKNNSVIVYLAVFSAAIFIIQILFFTRKLRQRQRLLKKPFKPEYEHILNSNVAFYSSLNT